MYLNPGRWLKCWPFPRKILIGCALLLQVSQSLAQLKINSPVDNLIPPSPEASALGKYVSVPVGLYTGVPEITIPLFELRSGDLSLPLSFSYHAGGHRVDEFATRTGLGWTLNAGGAVSRSIVGSADEYGPHGLIENSKTMNPSNFYVGSGAEVFERYMKVTACTDVSPDQFTFSVNNISGKFAFNWGPQLAVASERKVKIRPLFIPGPSAGAFIPGWEITDDNGNTYTFEAQETSQAFITGIYTCNYITPPVTSWNITKMRSASGHEMTFTYQPYSMEYTILASESAMHRLGAENDMPSRTLQPMIVKGHYLSEINTSEGYTARFIPGTIKRTDLPGSSEGTFPLEEVIITNRDGKVIRHVKAGYDYSLGRLTLKQLQELPAPGSSDAVKPPYSFSYRGGLPAIPQTGAIGFYAQDHWGFPNHNTKSSLLPTYTVMVNGSERTWAGADRSTSATGTLSGLLTGITYPAGGKTTFDYEANDYSYVSSTPVMAAEKIKKSGFSRHPGNGEPVFDNSRHYTRVPFTINNPVNPEKPVKVKISVSMGYCTKEGGFGDAHFGPAAAILHQNGEPARVYHYQPNSISDSVYLMAGDYFIETSTWHLQCRNLGWDNCTASITWEEEVGYTRANKLAGGARIKSITDFDGIDHANDIIRSFKYRLPGADSALSSGVIGVEPKYEYTMYLHEGDEYSPILNQVMYTCRQSSSVVPAAHTKGSHIGYSHVDVLNGYRGEGGMSSSRFTTFRDYNDVLKVDFPFAPHTSYDYKRGQLISQTDYKNENGNFIQVRVTENDYYNEADQVVGYKVGKLIGGGGPWSPIFLNRFAADDYRVVLGISKIKSTKISDYENGRVYTREKQFQYDPKLQYLLKETSPIHENKKLVTEYAYADQYQVSGGILAEMKARNIIAPVIEEVRKEQAADGTEKVLNAFFNRYAMHNGRPVLSSISQTESATPISDLQLSLNNGGNSDTRYYREISGYNSYNNSGKPLQVSGSGNDTACMIYAYRNLLPVASVVNATQDRCAFTGFETEEQGNWNYTEYPDSHSLESHTGNRSFKGSLYSQFLPSGKYIISLWARSATGGTVTVNGIARAASTNWKRLQWVIDGPGRITVNTGGSWIDDLRLHPAEAQMKTFNYIHGIGLSSVTDENHQSVYYEYDGYGRLKITRNNEGNITHHYRYQYK
ncbi:MAG: hypothetical protein ACTHMC_10535 [Pseudobacter sp.]|uniref:hypothetical protein n=1 Tax=Pseudobacter sp. TaxID=2045420 RepID=UPI003F818E82